MKTRTRSRTRPQIWPRTKPRTRSRTIPRISPRMKTRTRSRTRPQIGPKTTWLYLLYLEIRLDLDLEIDLDLKLKQELDLEFFRNFRDVNLCPIENLKQSALEVTALDGKIFNPNPHKSQIFTFFGFFFPLSHLEILSLFQSTEFAQKKEKIKNL